MNTSVQQSINGELSSFSCASISSTAPAGTACGLSCCPGRCNGRGGWIYI